MSAHWIVYPVRINKRFSRIRQIVLIIALPIEVSLFVDDLEIHIEEQNDVKTRPGSESSIMGASWRIRNNESNAGGSGDFSE